MARAAWMLKYFGATNVRILNGGLTKWMAEGRPIVGGEQSKSSPSSKIDNDLDYSYSVEDPGACITDVKKM